MRTKIIGIAALLAAIVLSGASCSMAVSRQQTNQPPQLVGNDRDAHGCIPSAGYSWCEVKQKCLRPWEEKCVAATSTTISYLISEADPLKYCNGADMDSVGYGKTITVEKSTTTPETNLTEAQIAKKTAILATSGMCQTVLSQLPDFTVANGTVTIPPIEGWAGVSIVMCFCTPQVETNLLRLPGITKVSWGSN